MEKILRPRLTKHTPMFYICETKELNFLRKQNRRLKMTTASTMTDLNGIVGNYLGDTYTKFGVE